MTYMLLLNCALKLVEEIILYCDSPIHGLLGENNNAVIEEYENITPTLFDDTIMRVNFKLQIIKHRIPKQIKDMAALCVT